MTVNSSHSINWNVFPFRDHPRTKWDVLQDRRAFLVQELDRLDAELSGLENTECNLLCANCNMTLLTERDFAEHFIIPDERYLNLGNCIRPKVAR